MIPEKPNKLYECVNKTCRVIFVKKKLFPWSFLSLLNLMLKVPCFQHNFISYTFLTEIFMRGTDTKLDVYVCGIIEMDRHKTYLTLNFLHIYVKLKLFQCSEFCVEWQVWLITVFMWETCLNKSAFRLKSQGFQDQDIEIANHTEDPTSC